MPPNHQASSNYGIRHGSCQKTCLLTIKPVLTIVTASLMTMPSGVPCQKTVYPDDQASTNHSKKTACPDAQASTNHSNSFDDNNAFNMYLVKKLHLLTTTPILTIVTASLMTMPLTWILSKNCVSWRPNQYWVFTCTPRVGSTSNTSENKHIYFSSYVPQLEYACPNTQMVLKKECLTMELASHKRMWSGRKEFANLCCITTWAASERTPWSNLMNVYIYIW